MNSGKQIAARGDPSRLLRAWKSCIFVTRNNNPWTGGGDICRLHICYVCYICGKHVRTFYWLYQYKLMYNDTLLLQFLSLASYMQLIIRPFFISSDRVIHIYINCIFYTINHFYKIMLLPLCILESCNLLYNVYPKTNIPAPRPAVIFIVRRNNDKKNKTKVITSSWLRSGCNDK